MRPLLLAIAIFVATALFYLWLTFTGSQWSPTLLLVAYLIFFFAVTGAFWPRPREWSLGKRVAAGAILGFAAAIVSGGVSEVWFRGFSQVLERGLDVYFFPSISLGWLYGALVMSMLASVDIVRK
jgi:hypothetical protein